MVFLSSLNYKRPLFGYFSFILLSKLAICFKSGMLTLWSYQKALQQTKSEFSFKSYGNTGFKAPPFHWSKCGSIPVFKPFFWAVANCNAMLRSMITANDRYSGNNRYSGIKSPDRFFHYSGRCLYLFSDWEHREIRDRWEFGVPSACRLQTGDCWRGWLPGVDTIF